MIAGIFHAGSGLGNMLHRYVAARTLAKDKGYDFGMIAPELFKGGSFMNLNMGITPKYTYTIEPSTGKVLVDSEFPLWKEQTDYYNPEFNFVEDNTIIDGEFQSIQYFGHRVDEVSEWLNVEPIETRDDTCYIGFRGGEFSIFPELFLPQSYWEEAIEIMKDKGIKKFEIHTDDAPLAGEFFKSIKSPVIHNVGINWRTMRFAENAIIANSSFYILPRLLSGGTTIAPRYWARHNIKEWSRPDNYYSQFRYI